MRSLPFFLLDNPVLQLTVPKKERIYTLVPVFSAETTISSSFDPRRMTAWRSTRGSTLSFLFNSLTTDGLASNCISHWLLVVWRGVEEKKKVSECCKGTSEC